MTQAVDYSFARPNPADLAAAGYIGALRYLAPLPNTKVITGDELASLHANKLAVGFVWEGGNQGALSGGYAGGARDALRAIKMLQDLGAPDGTVIYYVLEDPRPVPRSGWERVFEYARGVLDQGGPYRQGGYGSQALIEGAFARGLIVKGWQVGGWSTGPSDLCALLQRSDSHANPPPGCDVDDVLQDEWGQWPALSVPIPAPSPASSEEDMTFTYVKRFNDDKVWLARHGEPPVHVGVVRSDGSVYGFDAVEANVAQQGDKVKHDEGVDIPDAAGAVRKVLVLDTNEAIAFYGI